MERIKGYDAWKLAAPPEGSPQKHKYDLSDKIGDYVEFMSYGRGYGYLTKEGGIVVRTDIDGVWILCSGTPEHYFLYDEMRCE